MSQPGRSDSSNALTPQTKAGEMVVRDEDAEEGIISDEELRQYLQNYKSEYADKPTPNMVEGRFEVDVNSPLEELNSTLGKAYVAHDTKGEQREFYAMVCPTHLPYRTRTVEAIRSLSHPNFEALRAADSTLLSHVNEKRYVCVFERPKGVKLSSVIKSQGALNDRFVAENIIAPVNQIIGAFFERGLNHGCLNMETLYFGDNKVLVGECVSEPSGYSQPLIYEPLERMMSNPMGKGNGDVLADCFALGVIVAHLVTGRQPAEIERDAYIQQIIQQGSYAVLADRYRYSPFISDFLRGTLNDDIKERWTPETISSWLGGKHFNLIPPAPPREATRSYEFKGKEFFNRRALAHAFHSNWESAIDNIREGKLQRWAQLSLHRPELSEQIDKVVSYAGTSRTASAKANNEMVARTIVALDPVGPIRLRQISASVDGLGSVLADAMKRDSQEDITYLFEAIVGDLPKFWADQQKNTRNAKVATMQWRLQKVRALLRGKSLGFGPERVLYEVNPTMACQSPLLEGKHIVDFQPMLHMLDSIAKDFAATHSPLDRHSAAFLAARMGINKEVYISELGRFPELAGNPKFLTLRLLLSAQDRMGNPPLRGLCHWVAMDCLPILEKLHNRKIRDSIQSDIKRACHTGQLSGIARVLFDAGYYLRDQVEFQRAAAYYRLNSEKISNISNPTYLMGRGKRLGRQISVWAAGLICCITIYLVMEQYFYF